MFWPLKFESGVNHYDMGKAFAGFMLAVPTPVKYNDEYSCKERFQSTHYFFFSRSIILSEPQAITPALHDSNFKGSERSSILRNGNEG